MGLDESGKEKSVLVKSSASMLGGRLAVGNMVKLQCGDSTFVLTQQFIEWMQKYAAAQGIGATVSKGNTSPIAQSKVMEALNKAVGKLDTIANSAGVGSAPTTADSAMTFPPNDPSIPVYEYDDIVKGKHNKEMDLSKKEAYLDNRKFYELFGCHKVEFAQLPKWKQTAKKKQLNLF